MNATSMWWIRKADPVTQKKPPHCGCTLEAPSQHCNWMESMGMTCWWRTCPTPPPVDFSLKMRRTVKTVRRGLTTPFLHSSAMKGPPIPLNCSDSLPLIPWIQMRMATWTSSSLPTLGMKLTMTDAFNCGKTMEPLRRPFGL